MDVWGLILSGIGAVLIAAGSGTRRERYRYVATRCTNPSWARLSAAVTYIVLAG